MDRLRIVVGFKVTPDYEALRASDWARAAGGRNGDRRRPGGPETRYVRRVFNVFDEAALELALRLRDARAEAGLETSLAAFSVAGREADPFLQTLQALGFDARRPRGARRRPRLRAAGHRRRHRRVSAADRAAGRAAARQPLRPRRERRRAVPGRRRARPALPDGGHRSPGGLPRPPPRDLRGRRRPGSGDGRAAVRARRRQRRRLDAARADAEGPARGARSPPRPALVRASWASTSTRRSPASRPCSPGLETIDRGRAGTIVPGRTPAEKARALYETQLRARLEKL